MNKPTKFLALALGGVFALSINLHAAKKDGDDVDKGGKRDRGDRVEQMTKNLDLTQDQSDQVKAILAKAQEETKALRTDTTLTDEQRKTKRREINKAAVEQIRALLTPEQREKQTENAKKRRNEQKGDEKDGKKQKGKKRAE